MLLSALWGSSITAILLTLLTVAALACPWGLLYANHLHQRGRIVAAARVAERSAWGAYAFLVAGSVLWALLATGVLELVVERKHRP